MNTSFDFLRIVNTYGAFGSITKIRNEVILSGTNSSNTNNPNSIWLEYEFKCKPGNVSRTPCLISPYHYRLDWLMWFAAFQNYQMNPWFIHLVGKLLVNDPLITTLISHNPFEGTDPPSYIKADLVPYKMPAPGTGEQKAGQWWARYENQKREYMPPVRLEQLEGIYEGQGWPMAKMKKRKHK